MLEIKSFLTCSELKPYQNVINCFIILFPSWYPNKSFSVSNFWSFFVLKENLHFDKFDGAAFKGVELKYGNSL